MSSETSRAALGRRRGRAAGGIGLRGYSRGPIPGLRREQVRGCAEEGQVFGGGWLGFAGFGIGIRGGLFGEGAGVLEDGDSQAGGAGFGEELRDFGGGGFQLYVRGGVVDRGSELFEESGEFELAEELAAGGVVDRLGAHGFERVLDGHAGVDGDEFFREQDVVAVVLEGLAIGLLLHFFGAVERGFDGAELLDELDRSFVADAGGAGNVVDRVTAQGHDVDDAAGGTPRLASTPAESRMRLSLVGFRMRRSR